MVALFDFIHFGYSDKDVEKLCLEPVCAFHFKSNGGVDFIGDIERVVFASGLTTTLNVLDATMATGCGLWHPSGEMRHFLSSECRFFHDRFVCLETMLQVNRAVYPRVPRRQIEQYPPVPTRYS